MFVYVCFLKEREEERRFWVHCVSKDVLLLIAKELNGARLNSCVFEPDGEKRRFSQTRSGLYAFKDNFLLLFLFFFFFSPIFFSSNVVGCI